jgi:hypothetical protein
VRSHGGGAREGESGGETAERLAAGLNEAPAAGGGRAGRAEVEEEEPEHAADRPKPGAFRRRRRLP